MNRAERRRQKKHGKVPTYNMTHDSIKGMVGQAYQQGLNKKINQDTEDITDKVIVMLLGLPCKVLMEKFNCDEETVREFGQCVIDEYTEFEQSDVEIENLNDWLFEHCGFKFQFSE